MAQEPRDDQLSVRIPSRIREALEARAESERRSVADIVNNIFAGSFPKGSLREKGAGEK